MCKLEKTVFFAPSRSQAVASGEVPQNLRLTCIPHISGCLICAPFKHYHSAALSDSRLLSIFCLIFVACSAPKMWGVERKNITLSTTLRSTVAVARNNDNEDLSPALPAGISGGRERERESEESVCVCVRARARAFLRLFLRVRD